MIFPVRGLPLPHNPTPMADKLWKFINEELAPRNVNTLDTGG
jgi:hypothetical protein